MLNRIEKHTTLLNTSADLVVVRSTGVESRPPKTATGLAPFSNPLPSLPIPLPCLFGPASVLYHCNMTSMPTNCPSDPFSQAYFPWSWNFRRPRGSTHSIACAATTRLKFPRCLLLVLTAIKRAQGGAWTATDK